MSAISSEKAALPRSLFAFATAMTDCSVMKIQKKSMMEVLHRQHAFPDMFVAYLLARNIRYEEDLVDQLFNSSEKRLARVLPVKGQFFPLSARI
jgi:CRP/FNR family transcriptional regulator, cyclic AMP receptor protein